MVDPTKLLKLTPNDPSYFTPSIEDIRVGYECEIQPTGMNPPWEPYIISTKDYLGGFVAKGYIPTGYGTPSIRVPYLTKEQIEAEGWEMKGGGLSENLFFYGYGKDHPLSKEEVEATEDYKRGKRRYDFVGKYLIFGAHTIFWKGDYRLEYFFHPYCPKKNWIQISVNPSWPSYELQKDIYMGECKDINTLRYICKLLGIL